MPPAPGFNLEWTRATGIFQAILDTPQGLWVGQADTDNPMAGIGTPSGKIEVYIPELEEQAKTLNAVQEEEELHCLLHFPLILNAGRHMKYNANTLMRNPAWNKGEKACTVAMHPDDIKAFGLKDGQQVRVTTEAGSEVGELEMSRDVRPGTVLIPHGFGLVYEGEGLWHKCQPADQKQPPGSSWHPASPVCALPGGNGVGS